MVFPFLIKIFLQTFSALADVHGDRQGAGQKIIFVQKLMYLFIFIGVLSRGINRVPNF